MSISKALSIGVALIVITGIVLFIKAVIEMMMTYYVY